MATAAHILLAGLMQQLSQRLFAALALRKRAAIVAAAAGSPLQATAVHATAFKVVNERISDLLRPRKASNQGQQGHGLLLPQPADECCFKRACHAAAQPRNIRLGNSFAK